MDRRAERVKAVPAQPKLCPRSPDVAAGVDESVAQKQLLGAEPCLHEPYGQVFSIAGIGLELCRRSALKPGRCGHQTISPGAVRGRANLRPKGPLVHRHISI